MKKLLVLLALLFTFGCAQTIVNVPKDFKGKVTVTECEEVTECKDEAPPPEYVERHRRAEATGLDIDVDDNNATDIEFGGTNANDAGNALANLGGENDDHASEHSLGASDPITVTNLPSSCSDAQVLGGTAAGTGVECQADVGGAGSGDVSGVGDCADGDCLDGTSDGGTYISIYDGTANKLTLGDSTVLGGDQTVGTDELSYLVGVTSAIQTQLTGKQAQDDQLDDLAALSPGIGDIPYWSSATAATLLQFNTADREGYILQATGAYPDTVPALTNILNITKLLFPHAANPTTDTEAQCSWDTDDRGLECFDTTSQMLEMMTKCEDITLATPDDLQGESDDWPLRHFVAERFPGGVTITAIHVTTEATCTDSIDFEEWSSAYVFQNSVETMTLSGTQTEDDGIDSAVLDVDEYLVLDLDGTSPCDVSWFHITICYEMEDFD